MECNDKNTSTLKKFHEEKHHLSQTFLYLKCLYIGHSSFISIFYSLTIIFQTHLDKRDTL